MKFFDVIVKLSLYSVQSSVVLFYIKICRIHTIVIPGRQQSLPTLIEIVLNSIKLKWNLVENEFKELTKDLKFT